MKKPSRNVYNLLSTFSLPKIYYNYIFDTESTVVQLDNSSNTPLNIYPMGLVDGAIFYNYMCSNVFDNIQNKYFSDFRSITDEHFSNLDIIDGVFKIIDKIYNFDSTESLYDVLQRSNQKQIKYLFYTIRNQNFSVNTFSHRDRMDQYTNLTSITSELDTLLSEYLSSRITTKQKELVISNATDYDIVTSTSDIFGIDSTVKFYADYVVGYEDFYLMVVNSVIMKMLGMINEYRDIMDGDDPKYWCKINNTSCIQSCKSFGDDCYSRYIKPFSYIPFKSIYVIPQLLLLQRGQAKEDTMDVMIRSLIYSIAVTMGNKKDLGGLIKMDHNTLIKGIVSNNREGLISTYFNQMDFEKSESDIRNSIGLKGEEKSDAGRSPLILEKIYQFVNNNKKIFVKDDTRLAVVDDFLDVYFKPFVDDTALADKIINLTPQIKKLDNMLRNFPNDIQDMDKNISAMLKSMKTAKDQMKKIGGGGKIADPRESLLTSDSVLFRRVAFDQALFSFYRENNKTKLVNNVLFWKWSIALYYVAELIIKLDDNHDLQKINFNEV